MKKIFIWLIGCWAAMAAAAAGPTDNLRATYRNSVYTNNVYGTGVAQNGVALGVGSGVMLSRSPTADNWRSSMGSPISAVAANKFLGEPLTPPDNWDGKKPEIVETPGGGLAVWVDFAKQVLTAQAGAIEVRWGLDDGSTNVEQSVIAASPKKRPVRLYWTHERPVSSGMGGYVFKPLQNAGPTVQFGSNYKVHIYPTRDVKLLYGTGYDLGYDDFDGSHQYYAPEDGNGYVHLEGSELQAIEGTYGTFLIVYSRLDEALNERVMLAYEVVEVLEPTQTQINIGIGDQLKPQTRPFDTNELFPMVTRGMTDDADNGEIYVYQHGTGDQKNYLWAIRDSSANPWKIEVYWRAKEELDVVWPFEVDIYSASWKDENAQEYLRDTDTDGKAQIHPKVYVPNALAVEAMDYQVVSYGTDKEKVQKHVHIESGAFYTDYADEGTYALLKYTSGDTIWFQTVKSVPKKDSWSTTATLAEEIRPPVTFRLGSLPAGVEAGSKADDRFFYPGWIRRNFETDNRNKYPIRNPYNPNFYQYPTEWATTNELYSPIFPVNIGQLEVWWSKLSNLYGPIREGSGHTEEMKSQIFFPARSYIYSVRPPVEYTNIQEPAAPQIVLASGKGSAGYSLQDEYMNQYSKALRLDMFEMWQYGEVKSYFTARVPGVSTQETFTVENWLSFQREDGEHSYTTMEWIDDPEYGGGGGWAEPGMGEGDPGMGGYWQDVEYKLYNYGDVNPANGSPWLSFHSVDAEGNVSTEPHFTLRVDMNANLWINGVKKTDFDEIPVPLFHRLAEENVQPDDEYADYHYQPKTFHVALTRSADGKFTYYVNGMPAATFAAGGAEVFSGGDEIRFFPLDDSNNEAGMKTFHGDWYLFRLWDTARSNQQIHDNRYIQLDPVSSMLIQYGEQDLDYYHGLEGGTLIDSSANRAHGELGFLTGTIETGDVDEHGNPVTMEVNTAAYRWVRMASKSSLLTASPGRTFPVNALIYSQNNPDEDGFNPNEEHAFLNGAVVYAMRCDFNLMGTNVTDFTSLPYVLVQYGDEEHEGRVKMAALRVVPENDMYRFRSFLDAGSMIQSPAPLSSFQPANLQKFISGPLYGELTTCFVDRKGWYWAHQAGDDGNPTNYVFEFSYPWQDFFDIPGFEFNESKAGTEIGWMRGYKGRDDGYMRVWNAGWPVVEFEGRAVDDEVDSPIDYTFIVKWPDDVKGLYVNDTLIDAKNGLPAIAGQLSVKIAYQQSMATNETKSVKLIDPTRLRYGSLKVIPDSVRNYREAKTQKTKFKDLPPYLRDRFVWNPAAIYDLDNDDTRELELTGKVIREISYTYLWPNVLDSIAKATLTDPDLFPGGDDSDWATAMNSMPGEMYELTTDTEPFDSLALTTTGEGAGYVTLVMNDSVNDAMVDPSEVITMYVIKVVPELYNGYLHPIQSDNPLDQQMNMKYTSDFGGEPTNWEFEWRCCEPVNGSYPTNFTTWANYTAKGKAALYDWITIGDAGKFGLSDHYVTCRYRAKEGTKAYALVGGGWSEWCKPALAEGWIKRVLKAINPFEQRIKDYYNREISTQLSMLQQVGSPYQGDIPLNLEALDENGLLSIYETVLHQARKLSIDDDSQGAATGSLALALQMAAGRIAELYMVLGNEALADAMNPTVDLGNDSPVDDGADSSIFPFMNQCENRLDEEMALLRGRDLANQYRRSWSSNVEPWEYPYYNRLQWNFTHDIMGGHVAYTLNYGIKDIAGAATADDPNAPDGTIDVYDAAKLYPQGHGDAYGHYLSAEKGYYSLLRHPNFGWLPQIESILAGTVDITMSFFHEKRFALAAEAKAKTAAMIVAGTYRQAYEAGRADTWLYAEDEDEDRAWGVDEWATRGHLGAYYDWLTVNALLPSREPEDHTLIKMLDRESTYELGAVAASAKSIQSTADYADKGLNPLGIADNAVPFDISPAEIDAGKTHFEQIYERAVKATKVAKAAFDRAKKNSNALRDQNENGEFDKMVADEEAAIDRRLKEIYGYPYADDIGVGKLYPQGYDGPDLYHYNLIETYDIDKSGHSFGRYYDVLIDDYKLITTNIVGSYQAEIDKSLADYGWLGNIVAGAITFYQDKLGWFSGIVDPYLSYGGISAADSLKLPVAILDTSGDHMDGKVDYEFSVAAWTNSPYWASYYVGAYGFTPKPSSYKGQRRAEGEVQIALIDYAAQLSDIEKESQNVQAATKKLRGLIDELTTIDYTTQMGYVTDAAKAEVEDFNATCKKNAETIEKTLEKLKDIKSIITDSGVEALPKITGLSFDLTSLGRAALLALKSGLQEALNQQINQQQEIVEKVKTKAEELAEALNKQFSTYMANEERQKKVAAIQEQIHVVKAAVAKLEVVFNTANATRMKYAKLEAEGDELQNERERLRIQWAADLSQKRYRNMMYQILRDDELQRFSEAFELAAKYTFLAAKAYDYETGLLQSDSTVSSGSQFLSEIARSRSLGRFSAEGDPLGGGAVGDPGLADILYRMDANWGVLKTRLGFNNAQGDLDSFSLRRDLFGRSLKADGDNAWKNDLASCWCDDLRTHPVFAAHCQPFDPMQAVEPGFAIPFSTVIAARKDLFGNDLAGASTAYSSTYFATKLRGVGIWIETENASVLPTRPEVYLIPSGLDYMRVPIRSASSMASATRTWQVVDQVLPVPYSLTDSDWDASDWSVLKNVCANELFTVRRHPAIRAQVGASFEPSGVVYNARLIGRSVWNDQWYIFIPAASLNADNVRARTSFLDAVKDIHFNIKTYSMSGN